MYVALLDVLGYKHHLESDRQSGSLKFQEDLSKALAIFQDINDAIFSVQAISDTVIMTCNAHAYFPRFLVTLREVFVAFLRQGLFVRGGVAYSRHFQSSHLTYSHAIARAYELESSFALYPRIVVDDNILRMYESGSSLPNLIGEGLLAAENGVCFVSILAKDNWSKVHEYARASFERENEYLKKRPSAFEKHVWFERYLLASEHAMPAVQAYIPKHRLL